MGQAIYKPKQGTPAWEYSEYGISIYLGCVKTPCDYCYMVAMRKRFNKPENDKPVLKSCFKDKQHAKEIFMKEAFKDQDELRKHGLFFSFTSDFLPETTELLLDCLDVCFLYDIPIKILTKQTAWIDTKWVNWVATLNRKIAFGFTLTGHDEKETGCSKNLDRIKKMKQIHYAGFKTFASIEPIINCKSSLEMIAQTLGICDLYKVGLESGKKYDYTGLKKFFDEVNVLCDKVYWKDSLLKTLNIKREDLPLNCISRDFNIF